MLNPRLFPLARHSISSLLLRRFNPFAPTSIMTRTTTTNSYHNSWIPNNYPPTRRSDHIDIYQSEKKGRVSVTDPYQWLEDQNSDETKQFVDAQGKFTRAHLDNIRDRERLAKAFEDVQNYPKFGVPSLRDDKRWYWTHNSGLQDQPVFYRSKDETQPVFPDDGTSPGEVFFDINLLSEDGTASMSQCAFSFDGKYFAYAVSLQGSDFSTIYVRSTDSVFARNGKDKEEQPSHHQGRLGDELKWVKFSPIEWTRDSKGFFYQRYPAPAHPGVNGVNGTNGAAPRTKGIDTNENKNAKVYYHALGTTQDKDILVYEDPSNPEWMWGPDVTIDGEYLILNVHKDSSPINQVWVTSLADQEIGHNMKWTKLIDKFEAQYTLVCNKGPLFYIWTNKDAPTGKIVAMDINKGIQSMKEIIPAQEDATIDHINCVNNAYFAVVYRRNVQSETYIYTLDGKQVTRLAKDFVGSASIYSRERQPWFFVYLTGLTSPGVIGKYDFTKKVEERWSTFYTTRVKGLKSEDFVAEQLWYTSKDGITQVPMFVLRHKDTPHKGWAAAIQYGYGGFDLSLDPFFSPRLLLLCQTYGVAYVQPNIRGGGEFGKKWYEGGIRERKHNSFDDFVAATEHLVQEGYVQRGRVAIWGGSNGGLLVSASVNRAPEGTYGAAVAEVGVHDLLKFNKFTIGSAWSSDYGNPSDPHDFDFIHPISPLHNVPPHKLPAMLLLTADHDDRVVPMHSFKLAATLQHSHASNPHPLLLRVDVDAGHGAGKSTAQTIKENADKWAFVAQALKLKWNERNEKTKV